MNDPAELMAELQHEHDGWPFVVRTFRDPEGFSVRSFLRDMPLSHVYAVDHRTREAQAKSVVDAVAKLVQLAVEDLNAGTYRTWVLHWAGQ